MPLAPLPDGIGEGCFGVMVMAIIRHLIYQHRHRAGLRVILRRLYETENRTLCIIMCER